MPLLSTSTLNHISLLSTFNYMPLLSTFSHRPLFPTSSSHRNCHFEFTGPCHQQHPQMHKLFFVVQCKNQADSVLTVFPDPLTPEITVRGALNVITWVSSSSGEKLRIPLILNSLSSDILKNCYSSHSKTTFQ